MIFIFILMSMVVYFVLFINNKSFLIQPKLNQMVLYRDYLLFTMFPYAYYFYNDRYKEHYILKKIDSPQFIVEATYSAFIFIIFFMFTYRFFEPLFRGSLRKIKKVAISDRKILFFLKSFVILLSIFFLFVSVKYNAGILGIISMSLTELNEQRAFLSQGSGLLILNKIVIKSWIPMLSYVYSYLWFTSKSSFRFSDRVGLIGSIILGLLASVYFFEKSSIFFYSLGIVGVYVYSGGFLKRKFTLFIPVFAVFLVSIMYILIYQDRIVNNKYLIDIVIHRITSQSVGSVMAFHYFKFHDYFYLSGISNFLASLQNEGFQSVYSAIIDYYIPETAEISGAMSSFATGDAYGLFGYLGVLMSGFIVGVYYSFFEAMKVSRFMSISFIGIYGLFFGYAYVATSFYSLLWPVGIVYSSAPFVLIALLSMNYRSLFYGKLL